MNKKKVSGIEKILLLPSSQKRLLEAISLARRQKILFVNLEIQFL
jgi:hypothetical protein